MNLSWLNQEMLALVNAVAALAVAAASVWRVRGDTKTAKIQEKGAEQVERAIQQVERAIHDVRQSIRRSAAWLCLAITLLVLAILLLGWNPGETP